MSFLDTPRPRRLLAQLIATLLLLALVACAGLNVPAHHHPLPKSTFAPSPEARILSDSLDALLARIQADLGQPDLNLTLGVVKDGQVFLKKHYGYANPQTHTPFSDRTQLYLASTSKSLTGTLAAVLDEKGLVKLDNTLADYLPDLTFADPHLQPQRITMRALLTHTHGLKNNEAVVWSAFIGLQSQPQLADLFRQYTTALPDSRFVYSNLGSVLYSLAVERQLGRPWQQVMAEQLFQPLGMQATTCYVSQVKQRQISYIIDDVDGQPRALFDKADNSMSAAGGHLSTVDDLLTYLRFFLSEGRTVPHVLSQPALHQAIAPLVAQKNRYQSYERYGYGLGWEQSVFNGEQLVSRLGGYSGISSHLSFLPARQMGIVVLSNKKGMEALAHLTANYLYNSLLGKANTYQIVRENLVSLKRNQKDEIEEKTELRQARQAPHAGFGVPAGIYEGGPKSGPMTFTSNATASWGNLRGQLYPLSDSTALLNFGTMMRTVRLKKERGQVVGIYSNERYFTRQGQ